MGRLCEYMELYLNIPKASSKIFKTIFLHYFRKATVKIKISRTSSGYCKNDETEVI